MTEAQQTEAQTETRDCSFCEVPLATGDCPHIIRTAEQVTMSLSAWEDQVRELTYLRNAEAEREDAERETADANGPAPMFVSFSATQVLNAKSQTIFGNAVVDDVPVADEKQVVLTLGDVMRTLVPQTFPDVDPYSVTILYWRRLEGVASRG